MNVRTALQVVSLGLAATIGMGALSPAYADDEDLNGCTPLDAAPVYHIPQTKGRYVAPPLDDRVYGKSGVVLSIAAGDSYTVTGSITGTSSAEAGVVFAKASASLAVSVGYSKTVSLTKSGSWVVPANQRVGWVELGAHGYDVYWYKEYLDPHTCSYKKTVTKRIVGPTRSAYFNHS